MNGHDNGDGAGDHAQPASAEGRSFYDEQAAECADGPVAEGYETARRCAEALARFVADPTQPVAEIGCGAGLGGLALRAAGFDCIDGFDPSAEMLAGAADRQVYRHLARLDLSQPLALEPGAYANAVTIGAVNPAAMPPTVIDGMLALLPSGGCLAFSLDAEAAADGSIRGRVCDLTDTGAADLLLSERFEPEPAAGTVTIYVLRKR
ncbi:methyltransferase type 11 [Limibaculum sp. FT325]|uniref:methyltransferase type 11 n=1 Tax=Thermohalobaculum sediminis TaxID=2939436 RepID=UPI0020C105E0|nr:methyltransferase type 11 [Limibaculum sediminis]MCL5778763.1 methyltransferase type 11 [Limibaculum sediminis]